jgi:DNA modification methylase
MAEKQNRTDAAPKIHVIYRSPAELKPDTKNPNRHSAKQLKQLAKSLKSFGFVVPILVDKELKVVAGHARRAAAEIAGIAQVPTITLDHLSPLQAQAYMIADNKLAQAATWDNDLLKEHLEVLTSVELDFDLAAIGFEPPEIELLIGAGGGAAASVVESEPEVPDPPTEPISRKGDLWKLGSHLLHCADATEAASYERLLKGELADVVFTDPPYNVPIAGHASGLGSTKHSDFVMASGEMTPDAFEHFLLTACSNMARHSRDGAIHFICMDWRHIRELASAGQKVYSELKNLCVWVKSNAGMGSFYRSQHELIFVFKHGHAAHLNNVQLGRFGRNRTNVWEYPGAATPAGGDEERGLLGLHPTVKPVTLVADALMDCSPRKGIVLDPFAGSGSTIIAAERTGRRARAMEMDPRFVDVAIRRWQRFTRQRAIHFETGKVFDEGRDD